MTLLERPSTAAQDTAGQGAPPSWRARVVAVCVALVALAFLQDPGRIAADTKLDLTVDPWSFLGRSLHLWDPEGFFGQLQNQAYGYLWPMGPFFGLGTTLGIPEWAVQRLWWATILVGAFLGIYLLLRVLRVGSGWAQILAGVAYALAVRPQSALGAVSVEVWPMAVAPWVLIPLVLGSRRGNPARWAALSALAVTTAGGVNAVAAGAVLPLAVWWLLTCGRGPRRRQLALWWAGLTTLAIVWWLVPLVVLGQYSPPFLDWIESAEFTTSITDPTTVLRGASHWVAYLGSASLWEAGGALATSPLLILATGLVAAGGVAGLAMRSLPHRTFLVAGAVTGLVMVSMGHTGVGGGLGSEQIQAFLDGVGAPLRNVHKFDLVLRIPLIIALSHLLTVVWPVAAKPRWKVITSGVLLVALVASWWPALTGQLVRGRSYVALADHWRDTAQWLNTQAEPGRALIVPGASFAQFVWGRTQDEPLQALGGYPWGVRDAVPLSSAGNIRMLDAVETRLESGRGSAGLAPYLERMGVRYLVVRNDLAAGAQAPPPIRIHQALDDSPGIRRVAFFGPIIDRAEGSQRIVDEGTRVSYPAVEIFEVEPNNNAPDARVVLRPANDTLVVGGSPEAMLPLADAGMLGNRPVVLAGDPQATAVNAAAGIVTDTDRLREITFGYMRGNESATMTADQAYVQGRPVHDYRVFDDAGTTVALPGLTFDTSSSASDVGATFRSPRGATPGAAMDGALDTYWAPGVIPEPRSYWEVRYPQAVDVADTVQLALMDRGLRTPVTIPLLITTDNGETRVDAVNSDGWQPVPVPAGPTTFVRIELVNTKSPRPFGIREVQLPGEGTSVLELPAGTAGDAVVLSGRPGEAGECVPRDGTWICSDAFGRFSQDRAGLFRAVDLPSAVTTAPRIWAIPRDGSSITQALDRVAGVSVAATSTRTGAVAGSALSAVDRELGTAWQAAPADPQPALTVTLPQARTLRGIRLVNRVGLNASSPLELRVDAGGVSRTGFTDARGLFRFDPVTTDTITVTFLSGNQVRSRSSLGETTLPVGVAEMGLIGADDLRQPLPPDATVTMPCGAGPDILIDGKVVAQTSVTARVQQYRNGETLPMTLCTDQVTVPAGPQTLAVRSSPAWQPVLATFAPETFYAPTSRPESVQVVTWDETDRAVQLEPATAPRVLEVAENFNTGWQASGAQGALQSVRVDGWKQGFVVPAGVGGEVTMQFAPDRTYRLGLLAGLVAVLAVVAVALRPPRLRVHPATEPTAAHRVLALFVGLGMVLVVGPWAAALFVAAVWLNRRWPLPVVAFSAVTGAVLINVVAGVRPAWPLVVLQGCALALAWAAVARAGLPRAAEVGAGSASAPAPDVR